jgi:hypothetical protein
VKEQKFGFIFHKLFIEYEKCNSCLHSFSNSFHLIETNKLILYSSNIAHIVSKSFSTFQIKEKTINQFIQVFDFQQNEETRNNKREKERGYRTLLRLFLPTHFHQFNKFLRTISRNFWCYELVSTIDFSIFKSRKYLTHV